MTRFSNDTQDRDKPAKPGKTKIKLALARRRRRRGLFAIGGLLAALGTTTWLGYLPEGLTQVAPRLASSVPNIADELMPPAVASGTLNDPARPVTVLVQHAQPVSGAITRHFVAVLHPRSDTALSFQVPGRIQDRLVDTGDVVRKGQVLARLEQTDFELDRAKAEAELQAARRSLAVASEELDRVAQLYQSNVVSQAKLDIAQGARQEAASRLEQAGAQLHIAENAFGYTTLVAEEDGIVLSEMADPGQVIATGQPVLRLSPGATFEAEVALPENLTLPRPGAMARFAPWVDPGRTIPARLREISPIADTQTRTFTARFALPPEAAAGLRYGMTGQIMLDQDDPAGAALRLPSSAVFDPGTGEGPGVWRITGEDRLEFVPVQIHEMSGRDVLIRSSLTPADRVVRLGANQLLAGQVVSIRETEE
ncbi:efflux RND transporter periplasmic adaptor subunit [Aliiroseovarius crassostreae]|uniref:efflux RND transporter periplasmic adaptor subunit n=1 Tax=Aliiroseovarius crassostreae TaxID=154981 RepID=UPI003C7CA629